MQVLRSSEYRRMPWKNGAGETIEVAVSPASAGLVDFEWRISMASVPTSGPFSIFPGVDRTLSILEGDGLQLQIHGTPPMELTRTSAPFSFPADVPVYASVIGTPVTDLNVMTRRATHAHVVRRLSVDTTLRLTTRADVFAVLCHSGQVRIESSTRQATLGALDCFIDREQVKDWTLVTSSSAVVFIVEFTKIDARYG
jgi:environmental stress-induced protein Ves